jgi:neuropeptide Y receptor
MIWVASLLLASPLFIFRSLEVHQVLDMGTVAYCVEKWPVPEGRAYYSLFSFVFQYVFPIVIVTLAYSRICKKLRYRYVNSSASKRNAGLPVPSTAVPVSGCAPAPQPAKEQRPKAKEDRRIKRTNALFISIALIFGVSWLPLNMFNLAMDTWDVFGQDRQAMLITYAACHMMGMSSACTNPMLYGWLNENFRKEFKEILEVACKVCCFFRTSPCSSGPGGAVAGRRGLLASPKMQCRELTNGPDNMTSSLMHADAETTSFTHVL